LPLGNESQRVFFADRKIENSGARVRDINSPSKRGKKKRKPRIIYDGEGKNLASLKFVTKGGRGVGMVFS